MKQITQFFWVGEGPTLRKEVQILFLGWGHKIEGGSRNPYGIICNIKFIKES